MFQLENWSYCSLKSYNKKKSTHFKSINSPVNPSVHLTSVLLPYLARCEERLRQERLDSGVRLVSVCKTHMALLNWRTALSGTLLTLVAGISEALVITILLCPFIFTKIYYTACCVP